MDLRGGSQKIFIKKSVAGFGNPLIDNDSFSGLLELLIHSCMHLKIILYVYCVLNNMCLQVCDELSRHKSRKQTRRK